MDGNKAAPSLDGAHATISIAGRVIGPGHTPYLIAEIAQAHDGSLGLCPCLHRRGRCGAGADAVKFQTHFADENRRSTSRFASSSRSRTRPVSPIGGGMEFTEEQWAGLAEHAHREAARVPELCLFARGPWTCSSDWACRPGRLPRARCCLAGVSRTHERSRQARSCSAPGMSTYAEIDASVEQLARSKARLRGPAVHQPLSYRARGCRPQCYR